jgi:hypothetical protein
MLKYVYGLEFDLFPFILIETFTLPGFFVAGALQVIFLAD